MFWGWDRDTRKLASRDVFLFWISDYSVLKKREIYALEWAWSVHMRFFKRFFFFYSFFFSFKEQSRAADSSWKSTSTRRESRLWDKSFSCFRSPHLLARSFYLQQRVYSSRITYVMLSLLSRTFELCVFSTLPVHTQSHVHTNWIPTHGIPEAKGLQRNAGEKQAKYSLRAFHTRIINIHWASWERWARIELARLLGSKPLLLHPNRLTFICPV